MACCPLPHYCLIDQRTTSIGEPQNSMVPGRRAARAGAEEFRGATDSRDWENTATSLPHGVGVSTLSEKQDEPIQGTSLVLVIRGSPVRSYFSRLIALRSLVGLPFGLIGLRVGGASVDRLAIFDLIILLWLCWSSGKVNSLLCFRHIVALPTTPKSRLPILLVVGIIKLQVTAGTVFKTWETLHQNIPIFPISVKKSA
jgi:hypothetical protein